MLGIRYFVPYRDCLLTPERGKITYGFLDNIEDHLMKWKDTECVLMLYKNTDNIIDILSSYKKTTYQIVEPVDDQFLHISKCYNQAIYTSEKEIVAPLGIDFRLTHDSTPLKTMKILSALDETFLRIKIALLDRTGETEKIIFNPLAIRKSMVINIGGFDERFKEWGQEDDDLTFRIRNQRSSWTELYLNDFPYIHVWHEKEFQRKSAAKYNHGVAGDIKLALIQDNLKNYSKNVVNSYAIKL